MSELERVAPEVADPSPADTPSRLRSDGAWGHRLREDRVIFRAELSDAQDDAIRSIVAKADGDGRLDFLVVYGSVARGDQRADSDLDVYYETRDAAVELEDADPDSRWHVFGAPSGALLESLRLGDRFAFDLLRDALVVHDDGLFRALVVAVDEEGLEAAEG